MLVGSCHRCGAPATLRCSVCARTFCRNHLDADERICPDCAAFQKKQRGAPNLPAPPSRRG
ncbi:MAG: hypothetical protein ACREDK_05580 [Thermoplasmata archaeon]